MPLHGLGIVLASLALLADNEPAKLSWGDPAPALAVREFVQGEPIDGFRPGTVYVVEFWATWCEPCRESIPDLNKLQKEHPDVVFLGVSTDEEPELVAPFVKRMGSKMTFRVAIEERQDDVDEGAMSAAWLTAVGENGIPTAFIVNSEGRIAWVGHPDDLEEPLDEIVEGDWDIAAAWQERLEELAQAKLAEEASAGLYIALARRDYPHALEIIERQLAFDPAAEDEQGTLKFWILNQLGDREAAARYGEELLAATDELDVERLTEIAGIVACPDEYAIGDYGGLDVEDGMNLDDMPDENEDADHDADDAAEEQVEPATDDSADAQTEKPTDDEAEPSEEVPSELDDDSAESMEADASSDESSGDDELDLSRIDDPLLRVAISAGHQAVVAAVKLEDQERQATAARVLARAYALAGHPAQGKAAIDVAVEALHESIGRRHALIEQLREALDEE